MGTERMSKRGTDDLPELARDGLVVWVRRALEMAERMVRGRTLDEDGHLAFMCLCFLSKQIDHGVALLILDSHKNRDVLLIARTMFEGQCLLLWAAQEPDVRPRRWRALTWVHDWRLCRSRQAEGKPYDAEYMRRAETMLAAFGDLVLTPRARSSRASGAALPADPYITGWRDGKTIKDVCVKVGAQSAHATLYGSFSEWHHWGPVALAEAIDRGDEGILYEAWSAIDSASALATAFSCLMDTMKLVSTHLRLEMEGEIQDLRTQYVQWNEAKIREWKGADV
jgi:hypothetical protein